MSFFAPQAYTKETLSKAFEWLQHQPESIKQAAANPEMLVSIYLQAQRQGLQKIDADAPVSSKKFIDDLKTLSRDFAQFDETPANAQPIIPPPITPTATARQSLQQTTTISHSSSRTAEVHAPVPTHSIPHFSSGPNPNSPVVQNVPPQQAQARRIPTTPQLFELDEKSLEVVVKLQERFNLSSPHEALRMLVALGVEQVKRWD